MHSIFRLSGRVSRWETYDCGALLLGVKLQNTGQSIQAKRRLGKK